MDRIGGGAGVFLIAGLLVLTGFVVDTMLRRRRQTRNTSGLARAVSNGQLIWVAFLLLAILEVALASVKLLYPSTEMKLEMSALLDLVKAAFWPLAFVIFISYFVEPISGFLRNLTSADLDIVGNKIKLQGKVDEVSDALRAAEAKSTSPEGSKPASAESIASLARNAVSNMGLVARSQAPRILWVDDTPRNNERLIESFETIGMKIDEALDTDEGVAMLERSPYDLIVEDMGRPSGKDAGYDFLDRLKRKGIGIPVIVYAARMGNPELKNEAIARGAIAATNRPSEVFRLVTALAPRLAVTRA